MKNIFYFIILLPQTLLYDSLPQWITWNVGQGLFSTIVTPSSCLHFDFGGEVFPKKVLFICHNKKNILYLSHEHKDHYRFVFKLKQHFKFLCRITPTLQKHLSKIPLCLEKPKIVTTHFNKALFMDVNANSKVYGYKNKILFPGDSLKKSEKKWSSQIKDFSYKYWILAHHGSRTSTSPEFLKNMPHARFAIASSRKQKYGHPHKKVLERLQAKKIPVLKTQDWGHIHFLFK